MPFIRVRSKAGPAAEYDIGVEEATANPGLYEVIDGEPVEASRPATYPEPAKPTAKPRASHAKKPAASAAPGPGNGTNETPTVVPNKVE